MHEHRDKVTDLINKVAAMPKALNIQNTEEEKDGMTQISDFLFSQGTNNEIEKQHFHEGRTN
eukprot:15340312-Ditylum_brightwellii.AAC.1